MDLNKCKNLYRDNLLNDVIPFWVTNSQDKEYGGYFTCLDRQGKVFDTDKFIWLQCRQVWMFSVLYNQVEQKQEWLDIAIQGAEFLKKHGRDKQGNWYFSLNREGKPLIQPYNIFSDCFAAMAFGQLNKATGNKEYGDIAVQTYHNILQRRENPKGKYNKSYPGTRPGKSLSLPMILSNLVLEIEHIIEPEQVEEMISYCKHEVMDIFYQPEQNLLLELTNPDGSFQDSFEGRLVMPGHSLESMWFLMDLAERTGDSDLMKKTVAISINLLEYGWDKKYGGIFYMMDIKGHPNQQLEWDQKLWWVHQEAILAVLKGYLHTGDERCLEWFEKLHDYTWSHFADKEYGEWFGYLNRQGEVLLQLKGGKWKGFFHVPRFLYQGWKTIDAIIEKQRH
ncbi:MAG: AGE family epimerase/isomerase [Thermodesulfobacteriota bacterium]|nr:AGE family epimerase/isomerase [Thermodesulfobacteriota bacterium]